MAFEIGFDIKFDFEKMNFIYGLETFGPIVEKRTLDAIRKSLKNPECDGPDIVYSIAMDVGNMKDREKILERNLLYGTVMYADGRLGDEPIRSQGHIHAVSKSCGMSTPEIYEIWQGEAYIYMQETANDNPGKCYAIHAKKGDVVIVPPNWAHSTISASPTEPLVFGAWCVRDFGFEYDDVRRHEGLAFFPVIGENNKITWAHNENYDQCELIVKSPDKELYEELFGIKDNQSIYQQFEENNDLFQFVPNPNLKESEWKKFTP
jgi:glucose-6-phosphate isomerase